MVQGKASVDGSIALRGITLLNTTYKVLTYCILDKVEPIAECIR